MADAGIEIVIRAHPQTLPARGAHPVGITLGIAETGFARFEVAEEEVMVSGIVVKIRECSGQKPRK
jgi:hypothetical protein